LLVQFRAQHALRHTAYSQTFSFQEPRYKSSFLVLAYQAKDDVEGLADIDTKSDLVVIVPLKVVDVVHDRLGQGN
jgi:hypothetical protein